MDTFNKYFVGARGDDIVIMRPPMGPISKDDAIMLAATIVAVAGMDKEAFDKAYDAVCNA